MIYLDNAATTGQKPQSVIHAVNNAMKAMSANPGRGGHSLSLKAGEMVFRAREKAARFFNCHSFENVVFTGSCTLALNYVIKGLFSAGDHILISDLEHNSVYRTVFDISGTGVSYDVFTVGDDEKTLANIESLIRPNTKAIVCTHGSNVFGIELPVERIGRLCRASGLLFIVDAAQTAGVVPVDMQKFCIDYLCAAPHKGLYAPMGTGILITDATPRPIITGGTGSDSLLKKQPEFLPDKYESGTLNVPGIAGISAGIDFVSARREEIYQKEMGIVRHLYEGLRKIRGVRLYTYCPPLPVLSFNYRQESSGTVADYLNKNGICVRAGLQCAPLAHRKFGTEKYGTVRVSPGLFNTKSDVERLLYLIKKL